MNRLNLSKHVIVAVIAGAIGFFTARGCVSVAPQQPPPLVQVEQKVAQKADSKCVIRNIVKPDGTKEQVLESSNEVAQAASHETKIHAESNPIDILGGAYLDIDLERKAVESYGAAIGINTKDWDLDLHSDLKKDHRIVHKRVLLRWK